MSNMPRLVSGSKASVLLLLLAAGIFLAHGGAARACKVASGIPEGEPIPVSMETVGSLPILQAVGSVTPRLIDATGNAVPVVRDESLASVDHRGSTLSVWLPIAPLPEGRYRWLGSVDDTVDVEFFVDPTLESRVPRIDHPDVRLVLDEFDSGGCGGGDSCDGFEVTWMDIAFESDSELAGVLLELTTDSGRARTIWVAPTVDRAVSDESVRFKLRVMDFVTTLPSFREDRFCIALRPLTAGGMGERAALGCIDGRRDDQRIDDRRACAGGGATDIGFMVLACLGLAGLRRQRDDSRGA